MPALARLLARDSIGTDLKNVTDEAGTSLRNFTGTLVNGTIANSAIAGEDSQGHFYVQLTKPAFIGLCVVVVVALIALTAAVLRFGCGWRKRVKVCLLSLS